MIGLISKLSVYIALVSHCTFFSGVLVSHYVVFSLSDPFEVRFTVGSGSLSFLISVSVCIALSIGSGLDARAGV